MQRMHRPHKPAAHRRISFIALAVALAAQTLPAIAEVLQPAPLTIAINTAAKTLNPAIASDAAAARLLQLTHPALLRWNDHYQPIGLAAQSCTQTAPQTITCTLKPNLTYTNHTPATAQTMQQWFTHLQTTPQSPFATPLKGVTITAPTSTTLTFQLPSPTISFLATLTEIPLANPQNPQHGLGPYVISSTNTLGTTVLATTQPNLPPALTFMPVADATTRLLKLKNHEVDMVLNDTPPELVNWAKNQGYPTLTIPSTSYTYLGLNFHNETLANPQVRQALALALNRPLIREKLLGGIAEPAQSLLPSGHPARWNAPEDVTDPFSAETLLDEENLLPDGQGIRLRLTLLTSTEAFSQRLAQVLQAQLAKVGVEVTLRPAEWASFFGAVQKGQFDMVLLTWTGELQPHFYHQAFHSSQTPPNGFNRGYVKDATTDTLTSQILQAKTPAEQTQATRQLQHHLAQLLPYIPLYTRHNTLITAQNIQGCQLSKNGTYQSLLPCRKTPK